MRALRRHGDSPVIWDVTLQLTTLIELYQMGPPAQSLAETFLGYHVHRVE